MSRSQTTIWPSRSQLFEAIENLERDDPLLAATKVPTGLTRYWCFVLGWPDWLWNDTLFSGESRLPKNLTLANDLRLLANLFSNYSPADLLKLFVQMPYAPGEIRDLQAPDLEAAIDLKVRSINLGNPQLGVRIKKSERHALINVEFHSSLEAFRPIFELSLLIAFYRPIKNFIGFHSSATRLLNSVELRTNRADPGLTSDLQDFFHCQLKRHHGKAALHIDRKVLSLKSPKHEPLAWRQIKIAIEDSERIRLPVTPLAKEGLIELIQAELRESGTAPTLIQLAKGINMSERSLSRALSSQGISLRKIKTVARMELAKELLQDKALSLNQIAKQLGYAEASSFARAFKEYFAETPGTTRQGQ